MLVAVGTLACSATLAGAGGLQHWMLDLCAHFPLQCGLVLAMVAVLLVFLRQQIVATVFFVFAAWNGGMLLPQLLPHRSIAPSPAIPFRALLSNVCTENREFDRICALVRQENPDIAIFEEVNAEWMTRLGSLTNQLPHVVAEPREDNFGIALFTRFPLLEKRVIAFGDSEVPTLVVRLRIENTAVTVIATHTMPPVGADRFNLRNGHLQDLARFVNSVSGPVLLLGDLNVSPWSPCFRQFTADSGLHDTSRGQGLQFSWPTTLPLLAVPIDHCLTTDAIRTRNRQIGPAIGSDHFPLLLQLSMDP